MASIERLERLFFAISKGPVTFNKLCRASKLHPKTVRTYLGIIEYIQGNEKISIKREQFRVVVRETNDSRQLEKLKCPPTPKLHSQKISDLSQNG